MAGAIGEPVGHAHRRTPAQERLSRTLPRMDAHCPRRALVKTPSKRPPRLDEQLQHIPHHLRQVAVGTQKQMVQITQYER